MHSPAFLLQCFDAHGDLAYDSEPVTQLQHAWQCADAARSAGASAALQLAAWLHDVGHLLSDMGQTPTLRGLNDRHEHLGAEYLAPLWGDAVAQPVRLHVQAKRFLVVSHQQYLETLSEDSRRSLALQGGPMSFSERQNFLSAPFARDALRLRVWDDQAKQAHHFATSRLSALQDLHALMQACSTT